MAWFTTLAHQAIQLADNLAENITAKANELQNDILAEQNKIKQEEELKKKSKESVLLPWETDDESRSIFSQELMELILSLALADNNFTVAPTGFQDAEFDFNTFVPVATKLLSLDNNLSRVHAKLMPHMNEEIFWRNYYFRIHYLRMKVGLEAPTEVEKKRFSFTAEESQRLIYQPDAAVAPVVPNDSKRTKQSAKSASNPDSNIANKKAGEISGAVSEQEQLAAEVRAELGDDIDINDLDINDLGDLDDVDPEDLEIGDDQDLLDDILDGDEGRARVKEEDNEGEVGHLVEGDIKDQETNNGNRTSAVSSVTEASTTNNTNVKEEKEKEEYDFLDSSGSSESPK